MMLALLFAELTALYFLSRWLTKKLYFFFLLVFKVRSVAISGVTLLLFPGTVIHELSHLFTAEILGVPTGKLNLVPEGVRPSSFSRSDPIKTYSRPFSSPVALWRVPAVKIKSALKFTK